MVSAYTPNINLEEPARGDQVGTWDTPVNANMTLIDLVVGGTASILLAGAPVVLAAAQFQCKTIAFNSTLTANVVITFPTSFCKSYEIISQCTGSSAFTITLQSTSGGVGVCVPPNEVIEVVNILGSFFYKNLGRVGSYWDHAGSSVPNWVSGCSVPPYLNCDGTAFSSATYPNLRNYLGSATLPDSRGRARFALNQGTARISAGGSGLNGNTLGAGGGDELTQAHTHNITDPTHNHVQHALTMYNVGGPGLGGSTGIAVNTVAGTITAVSATGIAVNSAGSGAAQNVPPGYVGGIVMIRAG